MPELFPRVVALFAILGWAAGSVAAFATTNAATMVTPAAVAPEAVSPLTPGTAAPLMPEAVVPLPAAAARDSAGRPGPEMLPLISLEEFRSPAEGWSIAGSVYVDYPGYPLKTAGGTGVLIYDGGPPDPAPLVTRKQLGDALIEFEYMIQEEACSALLLQGRYELRLCDSRGEHPPKKHDNGGLLYGETGGVPPLLNASRAAGVWQRLSVDFRAPRFDETGRKTAHARVEQVVLNGETIHRSLDLPRTSPQAVLDGESPKGPLVLMAESGRTAFRSIGYYEEKTVKTDSLQFTYYEEGLEGDRPLAETTAVREGSVPEISSALAERGNNFALLFTGTLRIPETGTYRLDALARGDVTMEIAGRQVLRPAPPPDNPLDISLTGNPAGELELAAGEHPFTLKYKKMQPGATGLSVFIHGPGIRRQPITSKEGGWRPAARPAPIAIEPDRRAVVFRSYIGHRGRRVLSGVSVGDPEGVHYSLDLSRAALLHVWRGPFIDAGPIWTGRGMDPETRMVAEIGIPGHRLTFSGRPVAAFLSDPGQPWPDSGEEYFRLLGYTTGEKGRPAFNYRLGDVAIQEHLRPFPGGLGSGLMRELTFTGGQQGTTVWVLLAEGGQIERRSGGVYSVDDEYFVEVPAGSEAAVRRIDGRDELVAPVRLNSEPSQIQSILIW